MKRKVQLRRNNTLTGFLDKMCRDFGSDLLGQVGDRIDTDEGLFLVTVLNDILAKNKTC